MDSAYVTGFSDIFVFSSLDCKRYCGYFLFAKQIDHVTCLPASTLGLLSAGVLNLNVYARYRE